MEWTEWELPRQSIKRINRPNAQGWSCHPLHCGHLNFELKWFCLAAKLFWEKKIIEIQSHSGLLGVPCPGKLLTTAPPYSRCQSLYRPSSIKNALQPLLNVLRASKIWASSCFLAATLALLNNDVWDGNSWASSLFERYFTVHKEKASKILTRDDLARHRTTLCPFFFTKCFFFYKSRR